MNQRLSDAWGMDGVGKCILTGHVCIPLPCLNPFQIFPGISTVPRDTLHLLENILFPTIYLYLPRSFFLFLASPGAINGRRVAEDAINKCTKFLFVLSFVCRQNGKWVRLNVG